MLSLFPCRDEKDATASTASEQDHGRLYLPLFFFFSLLPLRCGHPGETSCYVVSRPITEPKAAAAFPGVRRRRRGATLKHVCRLGFVLMASSCCIRISACSWSLSRFFRHLILKCCQWCAGFHWCHYRLVGDKKLKLEQGVAQTLKAVVHCASHRRYRYRAFKCSAGSSRARSSPTRSILIQ